MVDLNHRTTSSSLLAQPPSTSQSSMVQQQRQQQQSSISHDTSHHSSSPLSSSSPSSHSTSVHAQATTHSYDDAGDDITPPLPPKCIDNPDDDKGDEQLMVHQAQYNDDDDDDNDDEKVNPNNSLDGPGGGVVFAAAHLHELTDNSIPMNDDDDKSINGGNSDNKNKDDVAHELFDVVMNSVVSPSISQDLLTCGNLIKPLPLASLVSTTSPQHSNTHETTSTPQSSTLTWQIENYASLSDARVLSDTFVCGGYTWRGVLFPRGNGNCTSHLSLYIELFSNEPTSQPPDVSPSKTQLVTPVNCHFDFTVLNSCANSSICQGASHQWIECGTDRGFEKLISLDMLYSAGSGFIIDGAITLIMKLDTSASAHNSPIGFEPDSYNLYSCRQDTGYVGLRNQGATCYMNSLLQTLFHLTAFRKAVYQMPTHSDKHSCSVPLALQRVFARLQTSMKSVSTKELTASFGWKSVDAFMQHDVQEFSRVLCDNLEEKMKGTRVEGSIPRLFEGASQCYIECINVDYRSTREEKFLDLSLNVKGCRDIIESFRQYVEVETLQGDNQYRAHNHGLQDARKGVRFLTLPPVLFLQLKRFEYDPERNAMVKLNDRFEFPLELDLSEFVDHDAANAARQAATSTEAISPTQLNIDKPDNAATTSSDLNSSAVDSDTHDYVLQSVLVHSGSVYGGHYYSYTATNTPASLDALSRPPSPSSPSSTVLPPTNNVSSHLASLNDWLKFDDDMVVRVSAEQACDAHFGGDQDIQVRGVNGRRLRDYRSRSANAYMLVYVRRTCFHEMVAPLSDDDIPLVLRQRFEKDDEIEQQAKQEREDEATKITLRFCTIDALGNIHDDDDDEDDEDENDVRLPTSPSVTGDETTGGGSGNNIHDDDRRSRFEGAGAELQFERQAIDIRVYASDTIEHVQLRVEQCTGVVAHHQMWFAYAARENKTKRPNTRTLTPLTTISGDASTVVPCIIDSSYSSMRSNHHHQHVSHRNLLRQAKGKTSFIVVDSSHNNALREGAGLELLPSHQHSSCISGTDASLVLIFFKRFDVQQQLLSVLDACLFYKHESIACLYAIAKFLIGVPHSSRLELVEEEDVYGGKITVMNNLNATIEQCNLLCGDIICFQLLDANHSYSASPDSSSSLPSPTTSNISMITTPIPRCFYTSVYDYLLFLRERVRVRLVELDSNLNEQGEYSGADCTQHHQHDNMDEQQTRPCKVWLEMRRDWSMSDAVRAVSASIGADIDRVMLYTSQPINIFQPDKHRVFTILDDIANLYHVVTSSANNSSLPFILFWTIFEYSTYKLREHTALDISWFTPPATKTEFCVLVKSDALVCDLLESIRARSSMRYLPSSSVLRLVIIVAGRVAGLPFTPNQSVANVVKDLAENARMVRAELRAEQVPDNECNMSEEEHLFWLTRFISSTPPKYYGEPLSICVREGETFADCRERIQHRLALDDSSMQRWRFVRIRGLSVAPFRLLAAEDILYREGEREPFEIGVDAGRDGPFNKPSTNPYDRAIKIYN